MTARPTLELIAELERNPNSMTGEAISRLSDILKAWEAFDSAPQSAKWRRRRELYSAITGTSTEGRG